MNFSAENLTLGYGDYIVLKDINVTIPKNKITILVGSNGCGKSTLLKTMSRLLKALAGKVVLGDEDIFSKPNKEVAKKLSILTQSPTDPSDLHEFNLVKQGRYPYQSWFNQWSKEDEKIVEYALEKTGISDIKDKKLSDLSGGQKQRAVIARMFASDPDIFILDEPTTGMDVGTKDAFYQLMHHSAKKHGKSVLMITHDPDELNKYADRNIHLVRDQQSPWRCFNVHETDEEVVHV